MSRKATEILMQTTWMAEDRIFNCHDKVTDIDWELVDENIYEGRYSQKEITLISVFAYLAGNEDLDSISLSDVGQLEQLERVAVLEALKAHWIGIEIQENLE